MSHHGPVFHAGEIRSCGFSGVDNGRDFSDSMPRPRQETGLEFDPHFSGWTVTLDEVTFAGVNIMYADGNATQIRITHIFGPGGIAMKVVDLPEAMGVLKTHVITDEETQHRIVTYVKDGEEWGRDDITALYKETGKQSQVEMLAALNREFGKEQ